MKSFEDDNVDDEDGQSINLTTSRACVFADPQLVAKPGQTSAVSIFDENIDAAFDLCRKSHIADWMALSLLCAVEVYLAFFLHTVHHQCVAGYEAEEHSQCSDHLDPALAFAKKTSMVSVELNIFLAFLLWHVCLPASVLLTALSYPMGKRTLNWRRLAALMHVVYKEIICAVLLTQLCGNAVKLSVGRPRPNFYAIVGDNDTKRNSRMSFPSLHTGVCFASVTLLVLHLLNAHSFAKDAHLRKRSLSPRLSQCSSKKRKHPDSGELSRPLVAPSMLGDSPERSDVRNGGGNNMTESKEELRRVSAYQSLFCGVLCTELVSGEWKSPVLCATLCALPMALPIFVGCTRITDYWHHYDDVICGAVLGMLFAALTFRMFKTEYNVFTKVSLVSD